jgi:hypothetical protein
MTISAMNAMATANFLKGIDGALVLFADSAHFGHSCEFGTRRVCDLPLHHCELGATSRVHANRQC